MNSSKILLFDIDGVLVKPYGYRQAVKSTLNYFFPHPALENLLPGRSDLALFEAVGIISEWDMVAISSLLIADSILSQYPFHSAPDTLPDFRSLELNQPLPGIRYQHWLERIQPYLDPILDPSQSLFNQIQLTPEVRSCFTPQLLASPLVANLLHTRDIRKSITTRTFQNLCLGSNLFERVYQLSPGIDSVSLLDLYDQPGIAQTQVDQLNSQIRQGSIAAAAFTARPSSHPCAIHSDDLSYSPEAEQAIQLIKLDSLPIVGLGAVQFAAESSGLDASALRKPHAFHALSALLAALGLPLVEAIQLALKTSQTGRFSGPSENLHGANVVVFEDSTAGIKSLISTVELLARSQIQINPIFLGISDYLPKIKSLENAGAKVFKTTSEALSASWELFSLA